MNIAVEGCCHGELDKIYETIRSYEAENGVKVDLLLCCGDFQAIRNEEDLKDMVCPEKYREYGNFKEYFKGEKESPVLTVFVGGNHEPPDFLKNLYYGGWVAPNIYYLGHSGVLNVRGLRLAGVSGIYNFTNYTKGYFESSPYIEETKVSSYHMREFEVKKLELVKNEVDIFMSHDWPGGIENYGNLQELLKKKPYFYKDIKSNNLGNPKTMELLQKLKPRYWFSGHLHVKYEAEYKHENGTATYFLALDKVLPHREFLRVMQFFPRSQEVSPENSDSPKGDGHSQSPVKLCYDREWLGVLYANRDKMPLNSFPSVNPITLNEPTQKDFKFVDTKLALSGYKTQTLNSSTFYEVPFKKDAHKDPGSQRREFMELLGLPENSYFNPDRNEKLQVNFVQ